MSDDLCCFILNYYYQWVPVQSHPQEYCRSLPSSAFLHGHLLKSLSKLISKPYGRLPVNVCSWQIYLTMNAARSKSVWASLPQLISVRIWKRIGIWIHCTEVFWNMLRQILIFYPHIFILLLLVFIVDWLALVMDFINSDEVLMVVSQLFDVLKNSLN